MLLGHMKYIIHNITGEEEPVIFSEHVQHVMMAAMLGVRDHIVSAGFFHITSNGAKCYGESITLKVSSRTEDSALINRLAGDNL